MKILRPLRLPLHLRVGWLILAAQLVLASALADAQVATTADPKATAPTSIVYMPQEPADPDESISGLVRVRHDFGAPEVTESGGTRGVNLLAPPEGDRDAPDATASGALVALPDVLVLAPPRLAHSLWRQPTLYWYLSGPSIVPVRVTLIDFEAANPEPLLELDLGVVPAAGVYATSLAEHGVQLEPGHRYEWSVALQVNPDAYSEEPVAKTIFAAAEADPALLPKVAGAPPLARVEALAAAGYWYDALDLLARQIAADDPSQPWRELLAGLLEQVGLQQVAAFERANRGGQ
jgi:hypothetical protein